MALRTLVTLPSGAEVALDALPQRVETRCDGCGSLEPASEWIAARVGIAVDGKHGEGTGRDGVLVHLCGAAACQMTAFARRHEALWPPETSHPDEVDHADDL